ncbi:hypothetical protein [Bizionia arctica]|uniref:Phosphoribosylpyrophosphate synthetase n=1 Tax=Bizionia arctica TaxID=1495645 RepID=A0A917LUM3_9FLAO|nr:hypothetical protein [Bizionia arctica]GGG58407.1 hypothetical protein GCM10010976_31520 [Bizionia arctica]
MQQERNELDVIKKYQDKGYTSNFKCENDLLIELESKNTYQPEQITIEREHRFEGLSNPSDMSILYIIKTDDDFKGMVTASYGAKSDTDVDDFFKRIPKQNDHSNDDI